MIVGDDPRHVVIEIDGNWCAGYYWRVVRCQTGRAVHESGPYHGTRLEDPARVARADAAEWAERNDFLLVRR